MSKVVKQIAQIYNGKFTTKTNFPGALLIYQTRKEYVFHLPEHTPSLGGIVSTVSTCKRCGKDLTNPHKRDVCIEMKKLYLAKPVFNNEDKPLNSEETIQRAILETKQEILKFLKRNRQIPNIPYSYIAGTTSLLSKTISELLDEKQIETFYHHIEGIPVNCVKLVEKIKPIRVKYPKYIEIGYTYKNRKRVQFNKDNPAHMLLFRELSNRKQTPSDCSKQQADQGYT